MNALLTLVLHVLFEFLYGKGEEGLRRFNTERAAKAADKKKSDLEIEKVRKPEDMSKSVEQREQEAIDAFDKFRNR